MKIQTLMLHQGFFTHRIYRLSGKLAISVPCWILSLLRLAGGLAMAAETYMNVRVQTNDTFTLTDTYGWAITLVLSLGAFVDVLIALSLCYYLTRISSPAQSSRRAQVTFLGPVVLTTHHFCLALEHSSIV